MSNHNKLEGITLCACEYFGPSKKEVLTRRTQGPHSKAKYAILLICKDIDKSRLAFFLDIHIRNVYRVQSGERKASKKVLDAIPAIIEKYNTNDYFPLNEFSRKKNA